MGGDSLLDVGCGVGHLWEHCLNSALAVQYTGLDCHAPAIDAAARRHSCAVLPEPECEPEAGPADAPAARNSSTRRGESAEFAPASAFSASVAVSPRWLVGYAGDLLPVRFSGVGGSDTSAHQFDWVLLSGTFNLGVAEAEMWSTLRACLQLCRRGLAFNLLLDADAATKAPDEQDADNDARESGDGTAEAAVRQDDTVEVQTSRSHATDTVEEYCCYEPSAVLRGIRSLLVELGLDGGREAETEAEAETGSASLSRIDIVVIPGENYDVPYDFTVHVIL